MRKLFLDDQRPAPPGWDLVKSFDEFVAYFQQHGCPDVVSFDHDLGLEHYPVFEQQPGDKIPYDQYTEKTGYHCAKWMVAYDHSPRVVIVHSFNPVGARNICEHVHRYSNAKIYIFPYKLPFLEVKL